ncbi:MAG: Na+/H+ antiporter NhaC family protein [Treponema sp.]|nr:Na+/H+ antiporter NhaC family protein [Treponema sp.]
MTGTFWSLIPPLVAIVLALITKEVYSSLFIGILIGGIFFAIDAGTGFTGFITQVFPDGMIKQLSDPWNVGILVFLVVLGTMVTLMNRAGGSAAFGEWAKKHIKTKAGAQIATICLGILIFIDDYFNCLTVGSVMRPITDKYKVSREKLAYLIDATAAPICIIAPISSWAAAVSGFVSEGENGLSLFCKAIPFNFYAFFTIIMMFLLVFTKFDFGSMAKFERLVDETKAEAQKDGKNGRGKVFDLVFPIVSLIILCTIGMVYTGGFFASGDEHKNFIDAFAAADASVGLVLGSVAALILTLLVYIPRKVLSFKDCLACLPEGFKAMVPAILILTFAWTLKGMTDSLGAAGFVAGVMEKAGGVKYFLPALIFIVSAFLAFSTGTSWGTFGILIPICIAVFPNVANPLRIISISACMAGAVAGDHCSPISDTTIMASAGAQCEHVNHVSSQLPYVVYVSAVVFVTYIIAGLTQGLGLLASGLISWAVGTSLLIGSLIFMKRVAKSEK